jgi:hypothetical protein
MFPWILFVIACFPAGYVFLKQSWWFNRSVWNWLFCLVFIFVNGFLGMLIEIGVIVYCSYVVPEDELLRVLQSLILFCTLGFSGLFQYLIMWFKYQAWLKKQEDSYIS